MITLKNNEKLNRNQIDALINKIKALIYTRVSTEGQVDNYSIETQIEKSVEHLKNKGINEDEILVLIEEAESGDNAQRPMINYSLFLLEKGIGNKIVFLHPNRLSRHLFLQQQIAHKVWELGCDLEFVELDLDKDSPESMFMFNVQGSVAEYNKSKILADTKRGRKKKVASGKIPGLNRVYGYTFDKDLDTLVENSEEKEVYLKMVELIFHEKSCSEIARLLSKKHKAPKGNRWYQTTISRILRNPLYKGTYFYGKTESVQSHGKKKVIKKPRDEWYEIEIPRYISDEDFDKLQIKLDGTIKKNKNSGRPSDDYLLKGLGRCGRCGASVSSGVTTKTNSGLIKYYTCTRKAKKSYAVGSGEHNHVCRGRNWRVDKIDQLVWERVKKIVENPNEVLMELASRSGDLEKINELRVKKDLLIKQIKEKKSAVEKYIDLYANEGLIKTKQALNEKVEPLNEEIEDMEKDLIIINDTIKYAQADTDQLLVFTDTLTKYQKLINSNITTNQDKKSIVGKLIEKVLFLEDEIEIVLKFGNSSDNNISKEEQQNLINSQGHGLDIYVSDKLLLTKPKWGGVNRVNKWEHLLPFLDKLKSAYTDQLLSFQEIGNQFNCDWWDIKSLFNAHNVPLVSIKERAALKRKKDFEQIYNLHYTQKLTLGQIYSVYGFSPQYVRTTLKENGHKVMNYQRQH